MEKGNAMNDDAELWHKEVIPEEAERVLEALSRAKIQSFYLAGGTALALKLGHRLSRDLDFFSAEPFNEEALLSELARLEKLSLLSKGRETLHLSIMGIKVSFIGYLYPMLFPCSSFSGIRVGDPRDIACMKIAAVAGRGTRRDFVDLYFLAKQYGMAHLFELFRKKYARIDFNMVHALKSLAYFKDAEEEPMPNLLVPVSWDEITRFFRQETPKIMQSA